MESKSSTDKKKKRSRFQFSVKSFLVLIAILAVFLGFRNHFRAYWAYRGLSNDEIEYSATFFGPSIHYDGDSAQTFYELGTESNSWLVSALSDPSRHKAAHTLLLNLNHDRFNDAQEIWDKELDPVRNSDFDVDRIPELVRFWKTLLRQ